jgi:NADH-quinone oxidoreductase subunit G
MVNIKINNQSIETQAGTTILEAARKYGIEIPTLCYYKGLCEAGACRICVVEAGGSLYAACNTPAAEGMDIKTNSANVREARKINTELLLAAHHVNCPSCERGGNCTLQKLTEDLNIKDTPYVKDIPKNNWPEDLILIREESKCVKCLRCINVCKNIQDLGVWETHGAGARMTVGVENQTNIRESSCVLCGQCITHCPVGALYVRDDTEKALHALNDPETIVVVQIAPAVRTAWGEGLGIDATEGKLACAVRKLGADYVFDTNFTADLTIMEEASELIEKLKDKNKHAADSPQLWPMFTSCCPGWVNFVRKQYPEIINNLSTAKSPQQMFGAVTKSWFAQRENIDPAKICCVSVMPCTAKKAEAVLAEDGTVDVVLTSRELVRLLKACQVNIHELADEDFDNPLGEYSGAAVIFGATGGVMEAALRSAYYFVTGNNPDPDAFSAVRGDGLREATVDINGIPVSVAVVSGLAHTRKLIEKIKSGEKRYDFVEIMACPGGCVGGGGQPIKDGCELADARAPMLYELDKNAATRFSHENPIIKKAYEEFFEKPLSHKSHMHLHVNGGKN